MKLTDKPITAVATHIHWDHIGGHKYFPDFYAYADELEWLNGKFPLSIETIREMVVERCDLPEGFGVNDYEFFQGVPTKVLEDHDIIDVGNRKIEMLHTSAHHSLDIKPENFIMAVEHLIMRIAIFWWKNKCLCDNIKIKTRRKAILQNW